MVATPKKFTRLWQQRKWIYLSGIATLRQDMDDCFYTPAKTEKQLDRDRGFEFYGLMNDEITPDWNRKFYATIEKVKKVSK
jgi:hypothetical protein